MLLLKKFVCWILYPITMEASEVIVKKGYGITGWSCHYFDGPSKLKYIVYDDEGTNLIKVKCLPKHMKKRLSKEILELK